MPEVQTQQPECAKCGVEVRPDTDFCYNCGAPVTVEGDDFTSNGSETVLDYKSSGIEGNLSFRSDTGNATREAVNGNMNGGLEDRRPTPPKYESAAGLRRKSRSAARKPVEVTWEPEGESLNLKFVIAAICCLGLAIILIALAMYLR